MTGHLGCSSEQNTHKTTFKLKALFSHLVHVDKQVLIFIIFLHVLTLFLLHLILFCQATTTT